MITASLLLWGHLGILIDFGQSSQLRVGVPVKLELPSTDDLAVSFGMFLLLLIFIMHGGALGLIFCQNLTLHVGCWLDGKLLTRHDRDGGLRVGVLSTRVSHVPRSLVGALFAAESAAELRMVRDLKVFIGNLRRD